MHHALVVNLFGEPGCGKSTGAAYIFASLKRKGVNVEYVQEFAKDKTWENSSALKDQAYVYGCQHYRMFRCADTVDVIVTDSPLPLSIVYDECSATKSQFAQFVMSDFATFDNVNYLLRRVKPYNPVGRSQSEEAASAIRLEIYKSLDKYHIPFKRKDGDVSGYNEIVEEVIAKLAERKERKG